VHSEIRKLLKNGSNLEDAKLMGAFNASLQLPGGLNPLILQAMTTFKE
jgi:hypothetical protein